MGSVCSRSMKTQVWNPKLIIKCQKRPHTPVVPALSDGRRQADHKVLVINDKEILSQKLQWNVIEEEIPSQLCPPQPSDILKCTHTNMYLCVFVCMCVRDSACIHTYISQTQQNMREKSTASTAENNFSTVT